MTFANLVNIKDIYSRLLQYSLSLSLSSMRWLNCVFVCVWVGLFMVKSCIIHDIYIYHDLPVSLYFPMS